MSPEAVYNLRKREGGSILKSKLADLGYSQNIRLATVVAATTGWFQSKLEWLIQQPEKMQDWGFLPEHYKWGLYLA